MSSTGDEGPQTPHNMSPLIGIALTKVNLLRRLETPGTILGVDELARRLPGLRVDEIKQGLRELVAEGMVKVRFESTAAGKKFYVPPK
jgi:hypothetical protein